MLSTVMQLAVCVLALAVSALATPLAITPRDSVAPPITLPTAQTVWTVGETQTVTWDTSVLEGVTPSNPTGTLLLGTFTDGQELLMIDSPLAKGFSIFAGNVTLTVPSVDPGADYIVCLIGNSGNISPAFTIRGASSAASQIATRSNAPPPVSTNNPTSSASVPSSAIQTTDASATSTSTSAPLTSPTSPVPGSSSASSSSISTGSSASTTNTASSASQTTSAAFGLAPAHLWSALCGVVVFVWML